MSSTRLGVAALVVVALPLVAHAQPTPAPSIGLPLPPIGLPLPPIGLSPAADPSPAPSPQPPPSQGTPPPAIVFFGASYAWGVEAWRQSPVPGVITPSVPPAPAATGTAEGGSPVVEAGRLQLEITPRDTQIYVDEAFHGTWADLSGTLDLAPGTYRIDLRGRGYEPLTFDVRIVAGRTITYRHELSRQTRRPVTPPPAAPSREAPPPSPAAAPDPPAPRTGQTFYLIPGCYMGNIPPEQVKLPPGCDLTRIITHKP